MIVLRPNGHNQQQGRIFYLDPLPLPACNKHWGMYPGMFVCGPCGTVFLLPQVPHNGTAETSTVHPHVGA